MKRTKWFKGCKPVRVGTYERRLLDGTVVYSWWNKRFWCPYANTPSQAREYRGGKSAFQDFPWRGLQEAA